MHKKLKTTARGRLKAIDSLIRTGEHICDITEIVLERGK